MDHAARMDRNRNHIQYTAYILLMSGLGHFFALVCDYNKVEVSIIDMIWLRVLSDPKV